MLPELSELNSWLRIDKTILKIDLKLRFSTSNYLINLSCEGSKLKVFVTATGLEPTTT